MKSIRRLLPALFILALLSLFCTTASAADSVAVSSATELQNAVSTLSATGGTIYLSSDISLTSSISLPANRARITLDGNGHTINMSGNLALNGDMDIRNVCFYNVGIYRSIPCGGNDVHFYDTVTCEASDAYYPSIMTGYTGSTSFTGGNLTIDGGTWQRVRGGNGGTSSVLQRGRVTINGGSITEFLQVCGAGASTVGSTFDVVVNGGSIASIRFFSTANTATADATLTVYGGSISGTLRTAVLGGTLNGSCMIRLLGGDYAGVTGFYGYSGSGSLVTTLQLDEKLAGTVFEDRVDDTLSGTLLRTGVADPCIVFYEGSYYLTMTGSQNIALLKSTTLDGLADQTLGSNLVYKSANDTTAKNTFGYSSLSGTWSPELHYFSEEDFPGKSGWYMYLALRQAGDDSSEIRMVTLRSQSGAAPNGPYVHPTTGMESVSQPIYDQNGKIITEWGCGMSILRIEEGSYRGIYAMWVAEENRGTAAFRQKIMIAKMKSPWQLESAPTAILVPTQYWETIGSGLSGGKYYPAVVEGATALYGKDGQVYVIYCGSGYWTNYGLGQITWNGGDPQSASSWVKYTDNPIFGANDKNGKHYSGVAMQGAGHAFFIRDAADNLFAVYHAYPSATNGTNKASARNAYIEPCYIDYTKSNGVNRGVLTFTNGKMPASTSMNVSFTKRLTSTALLDLLDDSFAATVTLADTAGLTVALQDGAVQLAASYNTADTDGCEIRRKAEGGTFELVADLTDGKTAFADTLPAPGAYTYVAVSYIEHGGTRYYGNASDAQTVDCSLASPTVGLEIALDSSFVVLTLRHDETVDSYRIYRYDAAEGAETRVLLDKVSQDGDSTQYLDWSIQTEHTYVYACTAVRDGVESLPTEQRIYVPLPRLTLTAKTARGGGIRLTVTDRGSADSYKFVRAASSDPVELCNSAAMTCLDLDVVPDTRYYYAVYAYTDGELVGSAMVGCTAGAVVPSLVVTATNSRLNLRIPNVAGAAVYDLYRNDVKIQTFTSGISMQLSLPEDGLYTYRLEVFDADGVSIGSATQVLRIGALYDAAYDTNGDGICNISDALFTLRSVLDGADGSLADVLRILCFIAG